MDGDEFDRVGAGLHVLMSVGEASKFVSHCVLPERAIAALAEFFEFCNFAGVWIDGVAK